MTTTKTNTNIPYHLWRARKQLGLTQQQVAYLLGHKTRDAVYRFERGVRVPTLQTALMLEYILGVPVRALFSGLYEQLQEKVQARINLSNEPYEELLGSQQGVGELCTYMDILHVPQPSEADRQKLLRHITWLAKKRNELEQAT